MRRMLKLLDRYILRKFLGTFIFTMLVIMAVVTTIMTRPLLQLLPMRSGSRVTTLAEA